MSNFDLYSIFCQMLTVFCFRGHYGYFFNHNDCFNQDIIY